MVLKAEAEVEADQAAAGVQVLKAEEEAAEAASNELMPKAEAEVEAVKAAAGVRLFKAEAEEEAAKAVSHE